MPDSALSALSPTDTVTVRSAEKVSPSVAAVTVIVVAPAPSVTLDGLALSVISVLSLSVIVTSVPLTVKPVDVPATPTASLPSMMVSSVIVSVKVPVPLVWPASMVTSKSVTAV